ncbi:MAG: hypothetical protein ABJF10_21270 [Chthoniobacter sp.]|uniref:hypothetical protein n=1 Tax=Chthoniobacter sp. TaxID=2510640 RepID=UPI0032A1F6B2
MNPPNHLRFIVACLTAIALASAVAGGWLLFKGYQSGELFVGIVSTVAGGLVGMISMRGSTPANPPTDTTTTISSTSIAPVKTETQNP